MYYKVFIVTLAAVSVSSRPQSGNFQVQRQLQIVPVERTVFSESFVQNREVGANNRRDAASNQFVNAEVRDVQIDVRETTPKIEIYQYVNPNTEVFVSNNLNPTEDIRNGALPSNFSPQFDNIRREDNRNGAVTSNFNPEVDIIRSEDRTSEFFNTNFPHNSTSKEFIKPLQPNQRQNSQNTGNRENLPVNNVQNNLTPNMTNSNQNLYTNAANSLRSRPQQNNQFPQNNNINYNQVPNIVRDKTSSNTHNNNYNQTYTTNPDYRSNGNSNDQNRRTVSDRANVSNGRPSNSSFHSERPVLAKPDQVKTTEDDQNEDGDKWVWGYSNATESGITGTTPDLDDRANFDGGSCPSGKAKIGDKCVDKD